ncbi:helix-turn-helix domain-containing protein [Synechococcales cyanobacterium C]|uniref:Helix-turn-helix domain-containing protein n=1 Tax=Petrachloros mirabilis ULC683 TaxID=2781853 RepID=A0A8K2A233_9CYAN|nr:Crp/Fnr family transcriptional regulator [Petrachloros mirabilis]NCJ08303.1 helix-turn-helix domain-containing protein [Petrachloros mirabilis ULC683]
MQVNHLSVIPSPSISKQRIFSPGVLLPSNPNCLWKIESGVVRSLTWLEDGTVVAQGLWGPEDVVGRALSRVEPYQLECLTPVEATLVLAENWSHLAVNLVAHIQQSDELSVIRSYKKTDVMLLKFLNWLARKFGREVAQGHLVDLRLTHQNIADLIGLTRVTVTRVLNQLEQQGLIERRSRQQLIVNESELWHYEI